MTSAPPLHPITATIQARHGFFTRAGGVSKGPYASLNASLSGGDDPDAVHENRARVARALGATHLVGVTQIHGTGVIDVQSPWPAGAGPRADAMITGVPGLALGVITADCAPVLFHDPHTGLIGAAHAGWRGAAAGILDQVVSAMAAKAADPSRLVAVVGPCIAQASYEVGPDLRDAVLPTLPDAQRFFTQGRPPDRYHFDLAGYCLARLHEAGVVNAHALGLDTLSDEQRFFSHRRRTLGNGGPIGHQISAIVAG
jgi:YfiH family protein